MSILQRVVVLCLLISPAAFSQVSYDESMARLREKPAGRDAATQPTRAAAASQPAPPAATRPSLQDASVPGSSDSAAEPQPARMIFVCDASVSMLSKFPILRHELSQSIHQLQATQSFNLVFFQRQGYVSLDKEFVAATPDAKLRVDKFLETIIPREHTNPIPALDFAFQQKPDVIYLLTDGDFPNNLALLKHVRQLEGTRRVRINTIAFVSDTDNDTEFMAVLKTIAAETRGTYRYVRESDL